MNQKGVFGIVAAYLIFFVLLVLFFAIIIPAVETFIIKVWATGDSVLEKADTIAGTISDSIMRTSFNDAIDAQKQAAIDNVDILSAFNQYSWAIIAIIILGVYFLYAKQITETTTGV